MLEAAGVPFQPVDAPLDEDAIKQECRGTGAAELAGILAVRKALAAAAGAADLVLGSDQTLEREDGSMLSKASSREALAEQLRSLRGKAHQLHSSAVVVEAGHPVWRATESVTMTMRDLSDGFISDYLDGEYEEVRWSVGGYHAEGVGAQLFESIEGSHFAVLGLPLLPLLGFLRSRSILES
jgi:septum formation protein